MKNKTVTLCFLKLSVILLAPIIIILIPISSIENKSFCLYTNLLGFHCPGCGMTRAMFSIMHFQFNNAIRYNKLVILVFPILIYYWLQYFIKILFILKEEIFHGTRN
ncbi:MAG: DUF2752 domain-containing protein [Spirochaetes bacterium]|nr:DUF2752 domain-containing protein [Spirochaetota bacterium]